MGEKEGTKLMGPSAEAVRAELNRLLESSAFRTSKRCSEFLKYIVENTISGAAGTLKERMIGVELFQLPQDFDSSQHTVVRVTANEVRKKLAQYYHSEDGTHHEVRIELPPGSYSAEFRATPAPVQPPTPADPDPPAQWNARRRHAYRYAVAVALALAVAAVICWRWLDVRPMSAVTKAAPAEGGVPVAPPDGEIRMLIGSSSAYMDRNGRKWQADRYFNGGTVLARPSARILRTLDPDIYRHLRQGDFQYDIPLKRGLYELHLHFAETGLSDFISAESSGEGQRLFRVMANGKRILDLFDIVADGDGANVSDQRVFRNIAPAEDGFLHLNFVSFRGAAILNGIEVLPMSAGRVAPIRIRAGWISAWQDPSGQQWLGDSFFLGGNALVRTTNPARDSDAPDIAIYGSERWGHFSYSLPEADGSYRVILKFAEGHYGRRNTGIGGEGSRMFDIFCNGVALARNFDIFKAAGGEGRPIEKSFSGIHPNAQGKIVLGFVPVQGMACVNGIEVIDESR